MTHSGHGVILYHGKKEESMKIKILFILTLLILLTGCKLKFIKYDVSTLEKDVISVEIVRLSETSGSSEFTIINKVDDDKLNQLFNDLSKIEIIVRVGSPRMSKGLALKLNYADGYELICNTRINWFSNDDVWLRGTYILVSQEELNKLILKYNV